MSSKRIGALALLVVLGRFAVAALNRRRAISLEGATAVVCGASRGLGRAIALELGRRGVAKMAICARHEHDLDGLAATLAREGIQVCSEACDLSNAQDVERFFGNVTARLGPVDVLVTNAATITVGPATLCSKADVDEAFSSIFYTALNPILSAMPWMRHRRRGTIAVVTSLGARIGLPHVGPYCAAKGALITFAESIRAELARDGVNVLAVVPGPMRTGSHVHAGFKGDHAREYAWFGRSATAPLLSIDADRAARRIVSAIAHGKVELSFTPEARIAPVLRTLAPTLWSEMMAIAARFLPRAEDACEPNQRWEGTKIEESSDAPAVRAVKQRGRGLAERYRQ